MGKHYKKEEPATTITCQVMPDEYYKARIKQLEAENRDLNKEVEALEHNIEMLKGCIGELQTDMGDLILENNSLKDAVVRAALREVE